MLFPKRFSLVGISFADMKDEVSPIFTKGKIAASKEITRKLKYPCGFVLPLIT